MTDLGTFDVGDRIPFAYEITDDAGLPATPSTLALTITQPDQTTVTKALADFTSTTVGSYVYRHTATQVGLHHARAVSTVPNAAFSSEADVREFRSIVSLAAARNHLNMREGNETDDEELRAFLEAATEVVEQIVGPCVVRTYTDRIRTGGYYLHLPHYPVVSVTSVTSVPNVAVQWITAEIDMDAEAGILWLVGGSYFSNGPWTVVYKAGRPQVPARFRQAALEMVKHLWTTQRGKGEDSYRPSLSGEEAFSSALGSTFSIPKRVLELLQSDKIPVVG